MLIFRNSGPTVLLAAMALGLLLQSSAIAKDGETLLGVHQVLDPNSTTDDLGISVPIPISHPGRRYPANNDFPTGPDVGERLPDFTLQNQYGQMINFAQHSQNSGAIVVFFRSAVW